MSTRKRRKMKRAALVCGTVAAIYFIGFFIVQMIDAGPVFAGDWMNEDWHYIVACVSIVCFLLYMSIILRIYTRQAVPSRRFSGYMAYGVALGVLFILWAVSLLMEVLNIS